MFKFDSNDLKKYVAKLSNTNAQYMQDYLTSKHDLFPNQSQISNEDMYNSGYLQAMIEQAEIIISKVLDFISNAYDISIPSYDYTNQFTIRKETTGYYFGFYLGFQMQFVFNKPELQSLLSFTCEIPFWFNDAFSPVEMYLRLIPNRMTLVLDKTGSSSSTTSPKELQNTIIDMLISILEKRINASLTDKPMSANQVIYGNYSIFRIRLPLTNTKLTNLKKRLDRHPVSLQNDIDLLMAEIIAHKDFGKIVTDAKTKHIFGGALSEYLEGIEEIF